MGGLKILNIAILAGLDASVLNFRLSLLLALKERGCVVTVLAPAENPHVGPRLRELGIGFLDVPLRRTSLSPLSDFRYRRAVGKALRSIRADMAFAYTIKPIVHGLAAARAVGIPRRVALITGLGTAFNTAGFRGRALASLASHMYRRALVDAECVFAQNDHIAKMIVERKWASIDEVVEVPGSGVDTSYFRYSVGWPLRPTFLFIGRLLADKGIHEFVASAREVKRCLPDSRFHAVGDLDANPTSVTASDVDRWLSEKIVEFHRFQADVRPFIERSTAVVLPSYHEGMPRSILEAMSMGRAVITTEVPGCRSTVESGVADARGVRLGKNGITVPAGDATALTHAIAYLARNREVARNLGEAGAEIARKRFDVNIANGIILRALNI